LSFFRKISRVLAEHQPIGRLGQRLPAERLLVPLDALRLVGHVEVDVIEDRQRWVSARCHGPGAAAAAVTSHA
jgi:hypothetical protein